MKSLTRLKGMITMTDRAVLLSIKPKYCELIASGKKTVEVRKTRPKIPTPFRGYIYCTLSGMNEFVRSIPLERYWYERKGKVIGEFVCNEITKIINGGSCFTIENCTASETNQVARSSCLDFDDVKKYLSKKDGYAWHISDLKIYDKPKELCEFYRSCGDNPKCKECELLTADINKYGEIYQDCGSEYEGMKPLYNDRPPQSWCYVQEVK